MTEPAKETISTTSSASVEKTTELNLVKVEFTSMSEHFNVVVQSHNENTTTLTEKATILLNSAVDKMNKRTVRGYE